MLVRSIAMTLLAVLSLSPAAALASGDDVLKACVAGELPTKTFSQADYADALANMPADGAEYGDCIAQIQAARDRVLGASITKRAAVSPSALRHALSGTPESTTAETNQQAAVSDVAPAPPNTVGSTSPTTPLATSPQATSPDPSAALLAISSSRGDAGPPASGGHGWPIVPVILAFSVVALSAARGLHLWSRRPETFAATPGAS